MTDAADSDEEVDDAYRTRASFFARLGTTEPRARELAWAEFVARYSPIIGGFARRCGASPQDVSDIVQDVTTKFFAAGEAFAYDPAKGRFRGWLKTCTVRTAIRLAGKNVRFRGVSLDAVPEVEKAVEPLWADVWERQIVADALASLRQASGDGLPFRAFEQYVLFDRPAEVVAAELGTSVDNVHQSKTRMTKRLREIVARLRQSDV